MPMPHDVLASTKMPLSIMGPGGVSGRLREGLDRVSSHHRRSVITADGGKRRFKLSSLKEVAKLEMEGRWERPSLYTKEM